MENKDLYHYGVKGMKWGVRRYQNYDGTLTDAGKSRRNVDSKYKSDAESDRALLSRVKGDDDVEGWSNLHKEINTKSGSWYFSEGVSQRFKKAMVDYEKRKNVIDDRYGVTDANEAASEAIGKWRDCHRKLINEQITKHPRYSEIDSEIEGLSHKFFDKYKDTPEVELLKNKDEIIKVAENYKREINPLKEEQSKIWREMMNNVDSDPVMQKLEKERSEAINALHKAERNPERQKAMREFEKEFETELHGIVLNDLGYRNTARGRQFLIDNMLVYDD